jgi:hypothetical protein
MTAVQAISAAIQSSTNWVEAYLADFSDADLLVRPLPNANHVAWQLGNVIAGDPFLVQTQFPDAPFPKLPDGFLELHSSGGAGKDSDPGFLTKQGYLSLLKEGREATLTALNKLSDADLDQAAHANLQFAGPTVADAFQFIATHTLMHLGQFTVIRRKLGKPVLF